ERSQRDLEAAPCSLRTDLAVEEEVRPPRGYLAAELPHAGPGQRARLPHGRQNAALAATCRVDVPEQRTDQLPVGWLRPRRPWLRRRVRRVALGRRVQQQRQDAHA